MMRQFAFLSVATLLWSGILFWLGRRLIDSWAPPRWARWAGWSGIALSAMATLGVMWARVGRVKLPFAQTWQWVAFFIMGVLVIVAAMTLVRDVVAWAWLRWSERRRPEPRPPGDAVSRRRLIFGATSAGIAGAGVASGAYGFRQATKIPDVKTVEVPVAGLPQELDGFRIVQLSDVHVGPTIKRPWLEQVVARVNTLGADIVALTGDLVDGYVPDMIDDVSPIAQIKARHGRFFVTGNHEYYWDGQAWAEAVERLGWSVLLNQHAIVEPVAGRRIAVGGVTDFSAERHLPAHKSDPAAAAAGIPADVDFRLLLAHQPKSVWAASKAGWDLQLSGHTHGGQFYPWNIVVGLAHPFSQGLHPFEAMQIYVSRGTGYWGPPLRLGAPSEITLLVLKAV